MYNVADKAAAIACKTLKLDICPVRSEITASMTGGLVQEYEHAVLPSITPLVTFVLALASMLPCLGYLWRSGKDHVQFVRAIVLCSFGSFLFGW